MSNRGGYGFESEMRHRRKEGLEGKCEQCGKKCNDLRGHHIVGVAVARRNPALTPSVVRDMANLMMLCPNCHKKADADNQRWNKHDVAMASWALFDKDPKEVEDAQDTARSNPRRKKRRFGRKGRR